MVKQQKPLGVGALRSFFEHFQAELESLSGSSDVEKAALQRQKERLTKKALLRSQELSSIAIEKFLQVNTSLNNFQPRLSDEVKSNAKDFIFQALVGYTMSLSDDLIPQTTLDLRFIWDNWRFGPGTSNGVKGSGTVEKLSKPMTVTPSAYPLVKHLRRINPYFHACDSNGNGGIVLIKGSRLETVPKNENTDRTIAIEPSGNMCLQLAVGAYLEGVLRRIGLDISTQAEKNKRLAKEGSVSNLLATLDLQSASDCVTPALVELLFPPEWYLLLMQIRSPTMSIGNDNVELQMISTMGNGFTFPLMTLVLVALLYGNLVTNFPKEARRRNFMDWNRFAVFGDDIILPSHHLSSFSLVLEGAGFILNKDKSYSDGPFRESCGGDFYRGVDITPIYVKSLDTISDVYIVLNQVIGWSAKTGFWFFKTFDYLVELLDGTVLFVPEWLNPDQGVLSLGCPRRYKYLKTRSVYREVKSSLFDLMLAIGGFVEQGKGSRLIYMPRVRKSPGSKVEKARLPKGFLDGWDPIKRAHGEATRADMYRLYYLSS